jgi:hypothetical protein
VRCQTTGSVDGKIAKIETKNKSKSNGKSLGSENAGSGEVLKL